MFEIRTSILPLCLAKALCLPWTPREAGIRRGSGLLSPKFVCVLLVNWMLKEELVVTARTQLNLAAKISDFCGAFTPFPAARDSQVTPGSLGIDSVVTPNRDAHGLGNMPAVPLTVPAGQWLVRCWHFSAKICRHTRGMSEQSTHVV